MTFQGTSTLNEETSKEIASKVGIKARKLCILIASVSTLVLFVLLILCNMDDNPPTRTFHICMFLIGSGICCLMSFLAARKNRKMIASALIEQVKTTHHTDELVRQVMITDNKLEIIAEQVERELWLEDTQTCYESEHEIIMIMKGNLIMWVDKAGLTGGTPAELYSHVTSYIKKK